MVIKRAWGSRKVQWFRKKKRSPTEIALPEEPAWERQKRTAHKKKRKRGGEPKKTLKPFQNPKKCRWDQPGVNRGGGVGGSQDCKKKPFLKNRFRGQSIKTTETTQCYGSCTSFEEGTQ